MKKRLTTIILCLSVFITSIVGCSTADAKITAEDQMTDIEPENVTENISAAEHFDNAGSDFAIQLFKEIVNEEENVLISPLSVYPALAMTANGANNNTLSQMEQTLRMPIHELNEALHSYISALPNEETSKLYLANSIWLRDEEDLTINKAFLQTNANWYNAQIYKTSFDDTALHDINTWVSDKTDGMIEQIVEHIDNDSYMYLINALSFDAKWKDPYEKPSVKDGVFTQEDGSKQDVELMYSSEYQYIQDENAKGFLKPYDGGAYAFAALLPEEDISLADYIDSLSGEKLKKLLSQTEACTVHTAIPKFKMEYNANLNQALISLGMKDAFSETEADFSGIRTFTSPEDRLFINRVLHKTSISVMEEGTKAGASTVVEIKETGAFRQPSEPKEVYLDRPFVYMIIDCRQHFPIFIGTLYNVP